MATKSKKVKTKKSIDNTKSLTGIHGLDEVTNGGFPKNKVTLIAGGPGCGKSLLGSHFIFSGCDKYNESGVIISFEENIKTFKENLKSIGFNPLKYEKQNKLYFDHVEVFNENQSVEGDDFTLDGLFVRLKYAIKKVKAKRILFDAPEVLFSGFKNEKILRSELTRIFNWLKTQNITAVITAERGEKSITRYGIQEYIADAVICLDHRVEKQVSTRRLRIIKYRGSAHGTNEYPFLIDDDGLSVLPVTSLKFEHKITKQIIKTGIKGLNEMFEQNGFYRGSSVLLAGTAGCGKTTAAAHFAYEQCKKGEKVLYISFEESPEQILRNTLSVGINLKPYLKSGKLKIISNRPTSCGLELHLVDIEKKYRNFSASHVILDPITGLVQMGTNAELHSMLTRLIDIFKVNGTTTFFTYLKDKNDLDVETEIGISSVMDLWIDIKYINTGSERNRVVSVIKSRGLKNSNQLREFIITKNGIELTDVYTGPAGVLTGSARLAQEEYEAKELMLAAQKVDTEKLKIESKAAALKAQIKALETDYVNELSRLKLLDKQTLDGESMELTRLKKMKNFRL